MLPVTHTFLWIGTCINIIIVYLTKISEFNYSILVIDANQIASFASCETLPRFAKFLIPLVYRSPINQTKFCIGKFFRLLEEIRSGLGAEYRQQKHYRGFLSFVLQVCIVFHFLWLSLACLSYWYTSVDLSFLSAIWGSFVLILRPRRLTCSAMECCPKVSNS